MILVIVYEVWEDSALADSVVNAVKRQQVFWAVCATFNPIAAVVELKVMIAHIIQPTLA